MNNEKKTQIRKGVFETNSSSTHSICIAKDVELIIPKKLHFEFGEFGWQFGMLKSEEEKASYLYTGLKDNDRLNDFEKIVEVLRAKGIEITFEDEESGYVDHSDKLGEFLNAVCEDPEKLMRFLFSPLSFILTGNDNVGEEDKIEMKVEYPHDEYYKGN